MQEERKSMHNNRGVYGPEEVMKGYGYFCPLQHYDPHLLGEER